MVAVDSIHWPLGKASGKDITAYNKELGCCEWIYSYELMQYTGLKDYDNNEICEGDIVKIYDTQTGKFSESTYLIICNSKSEWTIDDCYLLSRKHHKCKVIGNIYENNDLLV